MLQSKAMDRASQMEPPTKDAFSFLTTRMHLVRFAGFAALAIVLNLCCQNAALLVMGDYWFGIYVAIVFGNAAGLFFKYVADKYWVFEDADPTIVGNSRKFAMYAAFGVFTTLIFWATELLFHYIFGTVLMTNIGAVIGLCIGYVVKYNLDKHITFQRNQVTAAETALVAHAVA